VILCSSFKTGFSSNFLFEFQVVQTSNHSKFEGPLYIFHRSYQYHVHHLYSATCYWQRWKLKTVVAGNTFNPHTVQQTFIAFVGVWRVALRLLKLVALTDHSLHCTLSDCSLARSMATAVMLAQLSTGITMLCKVFFSRCAICLQCIYCNWSIWDVNFILFILCIFLQLCWAYTPVFCNSLTKAPRCQNTYEFQYLLWIVFY
jgi:hypothetical protein